MKNRLWTFIAALVLLAVLGKFYAVPLVAQVRAAIVQDRDSKARNVYQEVESCFNVTNPCQITFAAVPAGKRRSQRWYWQIREGKSSLPRNLPGFSAIIRTATLSP